MTYPDKNQIISDIMANVPSFLLVEPIWLAYYFKQNKDGTYSKPPCSNKGHTVSSNSKGVTFNEACKDGYPGIKLYKSHPLIAFDIDDKEAKLKKRKFSFDNISKEFKEFIQQNNTYVELSPSKCGLRILMLCNEKNGLQTKAILNKKCLGGELYLKSGFVTITGDKIKGAKSSLAEVKPEQLTQWIEGDKTDNKIINDSLKAIDNIINETKEIPNPALLNAEVSNKETKEQLPTLMDINKALKACKLDQNEQIKDAYKTVTSQEYNHYDYWLKILCACHDYATKSNTLNEMVMEIVDWSKTDLLSFESEEDIISHWASLSSKQQKITYHTLFKFAQLLKFKWPAEAYDKKGKPTGKPMVNVVANFEYLLNYFNIEIFVDVFNGNVYINASKEILDKYTKGKSTFFGMVGPFTKDYLKNVAWEIAQENGYINVTFSTIGPLFNHYFQRYNKPVNILKSWLNTDPDNLSEDMVEKDTDLSKSNLDYLISCITFNDRQNLELARIYFDTFFFEMMMPIYNTKRKYSQRSFMLVMTGPEACRKTTFFTMLFPYNLRQQFITTSTETLGGAKSIRDFASSLVTSALVVSDEFEIFYNKKNDSLFKTYVTSDVIDYVPIYEKTMQKEYKNAVLAGTTNKSSLSFEQDSNRRLAMLEVEFIDTTAMECINWHHFYRDYIKRGKQAMMNGLYPWKLSKETIQTQYEVNEQFRAKSNLELIMYELFDFGMMTHKEVIRYDIKNVQNNTSLCKQADVIAVIRQKYPTIQVKPAELKHLLKRLCGKYTHTTNKSYVLTHTNGHIRNGIVKQGQYTRYVMPPRLIDDF